jgi:glycosyltransferase involved in cell wall biosynthesis
MNTVFSFDQHTRVVGRLLEALPERPDVALQNGALFGPGAPPPLPYVLLLDNTCRLAERQPPVPEAQIGKHIEFGDAWIRRERETYLRAHGICTFSHLVRRSLVEDYGIDAAKVVVTGAGANLSPDPEPVRDDDGQTLLFVGKESFRRKGGPVLLRAFQRLRKERPGLRLFLAGPAEPLDLPEGTVNLGVVPIERVRELLGSATVFVLPTLREPFGIAYLDAMLCKVPCVGTAVGVVPDTVGGAGLIVPPGDDEALAVAIGELLDDEPRRRAMGELGRKRVLERGFLWPDVVRKLAGVLESAIASGRSAPSRPRPSVAS